MPNEVKILKASDSPSGIKLYTFELKYWRAIHPEMCRHRSMSRTVESSRAKPIQKNIEEVKNNPFIPMHFTKNCTGMQAREEITDPQKIEELQYLIKMMASMSASFVEEIAKEYDLHKQVLNRYLEPYLYTKEVVTCTNVALDSFFKLRIADDAEPHIRDLAIKMYKAVEESKPKFRSYGEWHMPYITKEDTELVEEYIRKNQMKNEPSIVLDLLKKVSAARCARCSYKAFDGTTDITKDLHLFSKLYNGGHYSPMEHVCSPDEVNTKGSWLNLKLHGNHVGWNQFRKELEPFR